MTGRGEGNFLMKWNALFYIPLIWYIYYQLRVSIKTKCNNLFHSFQWNALFYISLVWYIYYQLRMAVERKWKHFKGMQFNFFYIALMWYIYYQLCVSIERTWSLFHYFLWNWLLKYKAFRHVETLFVQGRNLYLARLLLVDRT